MYIPIRRIFKKLPMRQECWICLGLFAIFSCLFFHTARDLEQEYRLYKYGASIQGAAFGCASTKSGWVVDYKFNYNGVAYQSSCDTKESWIDSVKFPTPIRIQFLESNPSISRTPDVR